MLSCCSRNDARLILSERLQSRISKDAASLKNMVIIGTMKDSSHIPAISFMIFPVHEDTKVFLYNNQRSAVH
jgi:hypothetical protein